MSTAKQDLMDPAYDHYREKRIYHKAHLVNDRGDVSPLCADKPRALNRRRHQMWTTDWNAVTCAKCLARKPQPGPEVTT